ncbi:hypothetical protein C8A00DRAFT_30565 [Chaetomidium leptoderma]|uniref:Uncharacterized protein n=1 Tax=Chaetomidium leptoderma TaxID=669021 RepID=A0AAN6VSS5_9PEZI|nr:hypothetical protein C8A00DRAFT_30565 [Chaetomidium leptoderma]
MCTGNLILFCCPCSVHSPSSASTAQGHCTVKSTNNGAYNWCDAYRASPNFVWGYTGGMPPNCPDGEIEYEPMHFRANRLCDECAQMGCPLVWPQRTANGRRSALEKAQRSVARAARHAASWATRKAQRKAAAAMKVPSLRVVDSREDDEAEIRAFKATAAEARAAKLDKKQGDSIVKGVIGLFNSARGKGQKEDAAAGSALAEPAAADLCDWVRELELSGAAGKKSHKRRRKHADDDDAASLKTVVSRTTIRPSSRSSKAASVKTVVSLTDRLLLQFPHLRESPAPCENTGLIDAVGKNRPGWKVDKPRRLSQRRTEEK